MFRAIFKFLSSVKLAIILLIVIVLASIVGTIYESRFNADVAQKYIYNAPWFNVWLSMLCINLFCVAAIRYPWKRHQTGFVITHAGIITLLIGAMIDRTWGIEGYVHLYSTSPGTNVMELLTQELRVNVDGKTEKTVFKINSLLSEMDVISPDKDVKIEIKDVAPMAGKTVVMPAKANDKDARPCIQFTLEGPNMGRLEHHIFYNFRDDKSFGQMAEVAFVSGMPPAKAGDVDSDKKGNAGATLVLEFQGKTFRIAVKQGEEKDVPLEGLPEWKVRITGYYPNFMFSGRPISVDDRPAKPVVAFDLIGPPVPGEDAGEQGDPHAMATPKQDKNKIAPRTETFYVFHSNGEVLNVARHGKATGADAKIIVPDAISPVPLKNPNGIVFYLGKDMKIRYLVRSRNKTYKEGDGSPPFFETSGDMELEKPVPVAWAPGAKMIVNNYMESATKAMEYEPRLDLKNRKEAESYGQGVKCLVTSGTDSKQVWVLLSRYEHPLQKEVIVGGKKVSFEFTSQTTNLPFTVALKKFRAPFEEGTTNFAAFEAILSLDGRQDTIWLKKDSKLAKDRGNDVLQGTVVEETESGVQFLNAMGQQQLIAKSDIERKEVLTQKISMNRPTTYPITLTGPFTGFTYKFSQANHRILPHDPENSDDTYSGVQILRDPGWFLEWFGSLMICSGIAIMFYMRAYFFKPRLKDKEDEQAGESAEAETEAKAEPEQPAAVVTEKKKKKKAEKLVEVSRS